MPTTWHRLTKEGDRAVLASRTKPQPDKGVWIATIARSADGQTTTEAIAKDGLIVGRYVCHCGQDRAHAMSIAADIFFGRR